MTLHILHVAAVFSKYTFILLYVCFYGAVLKSCVILSCGKKIEQTSESSNKESFCRTVPISAVLLLRYSTGRVGSGKSTPHAGKAYASLSVISSNFVGDVKQIHQMNRSLRFRQTSVEFPALLLWSFSKNRCIKSTHASIMAIFHCRIQFERHLQLSQTLNASLWDPFFAIFLLKQLAMHL